MVNNLNQSELLGLLEIDLYDLLYAANKLRQKNFGNKIKFCSIVNAKSGKCSEDCRFCAQSGHYSGNAPEYNLKEPQEILEAAKEAERNGSKRFGIVTSGNNISSEGDWEKIYRTIKLLRNETSLIVDASLGALSLEQANFLKEAGLTRYHHNLETSPRFFPQICTTHTFRDRLKTVEVVKATGMELCCGGLLGLGETWVDRIELALVLRDIKPDSVPLNFLHPIIGTPLQNINSLKPQEILKIIALFRIVLPEINISVCGGREQNLRNLQSWMFYAGANAAMLGNYLTTIGNPPEKDLQMIEDLGLVIS